MVHVSILVLRNAVPASITDSVDVFEWVNAYCVQQKKDFPFQIELLGFTKEFR
jgi:molybdopterin/thiamine biosynthesis adenylyltransferase